VLKSWQQLPDLHPYLPISVVAFTLVRVTYQKAVPVPGQLFSDSFSSFGGGLLGLLFVQAFRKAFKALGLITKKEKCI